MKKKHGVRKLVLDTRKMLPFYDCRPIRHLLEHVEALELLGKVPMILNTVLDPPSHLRRCRQHYYREQFHLRVASFAKPKGFQLAHVGTSFLLFNSNL